MTTTANKQQYLNRVNVWAFSFGSSVGWGAFIMSGTLFLPTAGPLGTIIGLLIGAFVMILIGKNYQYMMDLYPEPGGTYAFARNALNSDYGFLVGWFLALAYISMLWANATALELFSRLLLGNVLEFGFHYNIAGFEVYFGEIVIISALIILFAWICTKHKKAAAKLISVFAVLLVLSVIITSIYAFSVSPIKIRPLFSHQGPPFLQVLRIISLAPWAYIGFESISHSSPEFKFRPKGAFSVIIIALITSAFIYGILTILSCCAAPEGMTNWSEYTAKVSQLNGIEQIPAFYAVQSSMGTTGIILISIAVMCAVFTTFISMLTASSRLYCSMAEDGILPAWFAKKNNQGIPANAIAFTAFISCLILFLGRTPIVWVVDITTMGTAIAYGWTSYSTYKIAKERNDKTEKVTGIIGTVLSIIFGINFMFPQLLNAGSLAPETYLILTIWLVSGFLFFRYILLKDKEKKYGNSIVVWLAFMILAYGASYNWIRESTRTATESVIQQLVAYYSPLWNNVKTEAELNYLNMEMNQINRALNQSSLLQLATMLVSIILFFSVYKILRKRELEYIKELGYTRETMNKDPLTGVKSKHAYSELRNVINQRIKENDMNPFSIVVCDVNNLKTINDKLGHKAGDRYICSASSIICKTFKHSPVYRVGGDEFVVFLEGDDYINRGELLSSLKEQSVNNSDTDQPVIASGLADYNPESDHTIIQVFERADSQMYANKKELKKK